MCEVVKLKILFISLSIYQSGGWSVTMLVDASETYCTIRGNNNNDR